MQGRPVCRLLRVVLFSSLLLLVFTCGDDGVTPEEPAPGPEIACSVLPDTIDYGTVATGSHVDTTFLIINSADGTLNGDVTETCGHFSITSGGGPFSLSAAGTLTVAVRFAPLATGTHNCTITTGSSVCDGVFCTGAGDLPTACQLSTNTLDFDTVDVYSTADKNFTIKNTGGGTLAGVVGESCDHYSIVAGAGAYALSAGESLLVSVRFEPSLEGTFDCTVETGSGLCGDVSCSGFGELQPICQITPDELDFGIVKIGDTPEQSVVIKNVGGKILTGNVNEDCPGFSLISGAGGFSLATDDSVVVTVRYEPVTEDNHDCLVQTSIAGGGACPAIYCEGYGSTYWEQMESHSSARIEDIWANSSSDVFAVGSNNTILHYNGSGWSAMDPGVTAWFMCVWGSGGNDVYAGGNGHLVHYNGSVWGTVNTDPFSPAEPAGTQNGLWGASADNIQAVGTNGIVYHYNGVDWSASTVGTEDLNGVWGAAAGDVFAVGNGGTIFHFDGAAWTAMTSGTTLDLNDVWGSAANNVYAVGQNGNIFHFDGSSWTGTTVASAPTLQGIWGRATDDIYAVGSYSILRYNGTTWSEMYSPPAWLIAVGGYGPGGDVFAAGLFGDVLYYDSQ